MENKRDNKIFIVPILIFFTFLFALIGYRQLMGDSFSLPGAVYSTLCLFILNNISPADATDNVYLLIARYLAAIMLGFGIYGLIYKKMYRQITILKIRFRYRKHIIIFSLDKVGADFIHGLAGSNYKVILVEESKEHTHHYRIRKQGVLVFNDKYYNAKLFDALMLSYAGTCIVALDDDSANIELSLKLLKYLTDKGHRQDVKVLTHIEDHNNLEVIKDYIDTSDADENFDLEVFNVSGAAAKAIYDRFPPHEYFNFTDPDAENAIAIIGFDSTAEDFILENVILSHYKDRKNIKIYVVDKEADAHCNHFLYKYPFSREFVELIPVKLLNNKFFANFNWSKELIEKLSKVHIAYLFGANGAELINTASRFRQFLSGQSANYLQAPIVICYPEDTGIMKLLDADREHTEKLDHLFRDKLNVHIVNKVTDTCTSSRLLEEGEYMDRMSRVINYYYSLKYEFESILKEKYQLSDTSGTLAAAEQKMIELKGSNGSLSEQDVEEVVLKHLANATGRNEAELRSHLSIKRRWEALTYNKKSANRYAARHMPVKMNIMKNMGCLPLTRENILYSFPVIAPVEHKRWEAERMVLNYRYGVLPKDKVAKNTAKEILKIHDQLIPYDKLNHDNKEKDLNIFLLMPLLNSLKAEIKR